jgi:hypothetical protein
MAFLYYFIHSRFLIVWYNISKQGKEFPIWLIFFSGTLSSIIFYYLSWFLIALIHFTGNSVLLFIPSLFLNLKPKQKRIVVICIPYQNHSANSNGFLRHLSISILCILKVFSESLLNSNLNLETILYIFNVL